MPKRKTIDPNELWGPTDRLQSRMLVIRERVREVEAANAGRGVVLRAEQLRQQAIALLRQRKLELARVADYATRYDADKLELRRLASTRRLMKKYRLTRQRAWNLTLEIERREKC